MLKRRNGYPSSFFFSSRRRHTRSLRDWSSDVCSSDLLDPRVQDVPGQAGQGGGRVMTADGLEVRQSSASVRGAKTELRNLKVVSKLIDTSTCIGCKACEVACQEWNDLHIVPTTQTGTYQTMPSLDANYWNLIQFREREIGPD